MRVGVRTSWAWCSCSVVAPVVVARASLEVLRRIVRKEVGSGVGPQHAQQILHSDAPEGRRRKESCGVLVAICTRLMDELVAGVCVVVVMRPCCYMVVGAGEQGSAHSTLQLGG